MRVSTPHPLRLSGLSLALVALTGAHALAQQHGGATQEAAVARVASADEDSRELRRILVLRNGQAVRSVTRFADGQWEYKDGANWRALDARIVASAALEKDVLREMKQREKALGDQPGERVAFAAWLAESGLISEALGQLDRVLLRSPHERAALDLLASRRWIFVPSLSVAPEQVAAALDELLSFGVQSPRAGRELALGELARYEDREALRARLTEDLGHSSPGRRSFAAHALGRLFSSQEPRRLLMHAVLDASPEVRRESSFALGASEEPAIMVPVVRALDSANPRVRSQAAEALGNMGFAAAVEPLIARLSNTVAQRSGTARVPHSHVAFLTQTAYIQDFDVEVATFQAVADPQVNVLIQGSVLDAGVQGTQHFAFAHETKVLRQSLGQLTGERPGYTSRSWLDWWERNASRWSNPLPRGETRTEGRTGT